MSGVYQLINAGTGEVVVPELRLATTFWQRLRGLQFARPLHDGQGLLLAPCRSIHTHGMRFALDIVMVDWAGCVRSVHRNVRPWRMLLGDRRTYAVVETPAGALSPRVSLGDPLCVDCVAPNRNSGESPLRRYVDFRELIRER